MMKLLLQNPDDRDYIMATAKAIYSHAPNLVSRPNTEKYDIDFDNGKLLRLHGGGRADVYCFEYNNRRCCAKYFHDHRLFSRIKNFLGRGRAFSAYHKGSILMQMDIEAPKVVGLVMRNSYSPPILIMEMIEGFEQINLQLENWKKNTASLINDSRIITLASSFGLFTQKLHNQNVFHADFSPRNVLVKKANNTYLCYLIDLEDALFSGQSKHDIAHFEERLHRYLSAQEAEQFMSYFYTQFNSKRS